MGLRCQRGVAQVAIIVIGMVIALVAMKLSYHPEQTDDAFWEKANSLSTKRRTPGPLAYYLMLGFSRHRDEAARKLNETFPEQPLMRITVVQSGLALPEAKRIVGNGETAYPRPNLQTSITTFSVCISGNQFPQVDGSTCGDGKRALSPLFVTYLCGENTLVNGQSCEKADLNKVVAELGGEYRDDYDMTVQCTDFTERPVDCKSDQNNLLKTMTFTVRRKSVEELYKSYVGAAPYFDLDPLKALERDR
jgi:hypothetical protein